MLNGRTLRSSLPVAARWSLDPNSHPSRQMRTCPGHSCRTRAGVNRVAAVGYPSLSLRKAAAATRISYTQWRNLTAGMPRAGHRVQVHASAAVVARMAEVVNASPGEIAAKGRPDAAAIMVTAETTATPPTPWKRDGEGSQPICRSLPPTS